MFVITSQKRKYTCRKVVGVYKNSEDALDALAAQCPYQLTDYFTRGDAVLEMREKILRAEEISRKDFVQGWIIGGKPLSL